MPEWVLTIRVIRIRWLRMSRIRGRWHLGRMSAIGGSTGIGGCLNWCIEAIPVYGDFRHGRELGAAGESCQGRLVVATVDELINGEGAVLGTDEPDF